MVKNSSFKIIWDVQALEHFKEILEHLNEQSNQAPKIVKKAIFDTIKTSSEEVSQILQSLSVNLRK